MTAGSKGRKPTYGSRFMSPSPRYEPVNSTPEVQTRPACARGADGDAGRRYEGYRPIAMHLLSELDRRQKRDLKGFDRKTIHKLKQYCWPGSVRELRNIIEAAVVAYARSDYVLPEDLVLDRASDASARFDQVPESCYRDAQMELGRRYFRRLIKRVRGNKSRLTLRHRPHQPV